MKWDKLTQNVGSKIRLVPAACHLDSDGDLLPPRGEDWTIKASGAEFIEIETDAGQSYRLGKDHIYSYATDPDRSGDQQTFGFLSLKVQLFIRGLSVSATLNQRPGDPIDPPAINKTARARAHFIPELERLFRRQIQVLDRCLLNFGLTSHDKPSNPPDTWESLKPKKSRLYPNSAPVHDLSATDAQLLAEFYAALDEIDEIISDRIRTDTTYEYNCWNFLMHKVEHSLRMGENVIRKFCKERQFDATSPAGGTLLSRSEVGLSRAADARADFLKRFAAKQEQQNAARRVHPMYAARPYLIQKASGSGRA